MYFRTLALVVFVVAAHGLWRSNVAAYFGWGDAPVSSLRFAAPGVFGLRQAAKTPSPRPLVAGAVTPDNAPAGPGLILASAETAPIFVPAPGAFHLLSLQADASALDNKFRP